MKPKPKHTGKPTPKPNKKKVKNELQGEEFEVIPEDGDEIEDEDFLFDDDYFENTKGDW